MSFFDRDPVPTESIYMWMYRAGLAGIEEQELLNALTLAGKNIRKKDWQNYLNGRAKRSHPRSALFIPCYTKPDHEFLRSRLEDFPIDNTLGINERRWVPCSAANKPLVKWKNNLMTREEASSYPESVYVAENMKGQSFIVLDVDGDHDNHIDVEVVLRFYEYIDFTHALLKPNTLRELLDQPRNYWSPLLDAPSSFHLTFWTNRSIPTKHFPNAHVDILGNRVNQLRYVKNKQWNGVMPIPLTNGIWTWIMNWVQAKERK